MSKVLEETIKIAEVVLTILSKGDRCRTEMMKLTLRRCGSPGKFNRVLDFLMKKGYIIKLGEPKTRTPYSITDSGKKQLEIWKTSTQRQSYKITENL